MVSEKWDSVEVIDYFSNEFWTHLTFSVGRLQGRVYPRGNCGWKGLWSSDLRLRLASKTREAFLNKIYLTRISSSPYFCIIACGLFKVSNSHLFFLVSIGPQLTDFWNLQELVRRDGTVWRHCIRLENWDTLIYLFLLGNLLWYSGGFHHILMY